MPEQNEIMEEEINLVEYIRVLIKRKIMILIITFSCILLAFTYNQVSTKIFEACMTINAPVYLDSQFQPQRLSFQEVSSKIESGTYEYKILNDLQLNSKIKNLKFKILKSKDPFLLKVSVQLPEEYKETELTLLNQFFKEIEIFFKPQLDLIDKNIEIKNLKLKRNIQYNENLINSKFENIKLIETEIKDIENDLKSYFNNTQELLDKQKTLVKDEIKNDFSTYFLNSLIQQNKISTREMKNKIFKLDFEKSNINLEICNLHFTLETLKKDFQRSDQLNKKAKNIQYLQEPTLSVSPIKPTKTKNLLIGGILGFILSIIISLVAEFKNRIKVSR